MTRKVTSLEVRGVVTNILLKSKRSYKKEAPKESVAYTEWSKRQIVLCVDDVSKETIRHELCHAYIKSGFTDQIPDLSQEQLEEMFCEVLANFGPIIIKQSNDIHKKCLYLVKELKSEK